MIDFAKLNLTPDDTILIGRIVQRWVQLMRERGLPEERIRSHAQDIQMQLMDISAVHALSCPMKLLQWLMSDNADFTSDYRLIVTAIDRSTGALTGDAWPIFAQHPRDSGAGRAVQH